MTPVRWDPFRALNSLQGTMNRLFADGDAVVRDDELNRPRQRRGRCPKV